MLSGIGEAPGGKGGGTRASIYVPGMLSSSRRVISQRENAKPCKAIDGWCGRRAEFPGPHTEASAPIRAIRAAAIELRDSTP